MQDVYERLDYDIARRYRSKFELKRELSLALVQTGGPELEGPYVVEEDLDSLCKFIRSEATTLELATRVVQSERPTPIKKFNILQNPVAPQTNSNNDNGVQPPSLYTCV